MSTDTRTGLQDSGTAESVADDLADRIARSFTVGYDVEGYDHHYYRGADCVVVYDDRELDRVEWLDGRPLSEWVEFVADRRGWMGMGPHYETGVQVDTERKMEGGR